MKLNFIRPMGIAAILLLCAVLSAEAQTVMPMPIPYNSHGGMPPELGLALWAVLDFFVIAGLLIRFYVIKKDKRYNYQSDIKNFFYDLNDNTPEKQKELSGYDWYVYCKPDLNWLSWGLIIFNSFGIIISLSLLIYLRLS